MNKMKKLVSLLLCALLMGSIAFAEEAAPAPEATPVSAQEALADETLLATVNGERLTWGDVKASYDNLVATYGMYYDINEPSNAMLFQAMALEGEIQMLLLRQEAQKTGLDQMTEDEKVELYATADAAWQSALDNYVAQMHPEITAESSEEDRAAAMTAAESYFFDELGYTQEILRAEYVQSAIYGRVQDVITQDVVVTDEELDAQYQEKVARDKEQFENDLAGYVEYNNYVDMMMMYGQGGDMEYSWYRPAGFRSVKHILIPVDQELMTKYQDLQARLEEQMNAEEEAAAEESATEEVAAEAESTTEAEATAEPEPTAVPVTEEEVNKAKADVLASQAAKIEEINQKIADGVSFDDLIDEYGVNEDGTPSDQGMHAEPYKTSGYEVASVSTNYVPEFVEAAFSVQNIGDVSAPYLSDYGIHIVKYMADLEAAPIPMTAQAREAARASLLSARQSEAYYAKMDEWMAAADIEYTGVTPSMKEMEALLTSEAEEEEEVVADGLEEVEEALQQPEATDEPKAEDTAAE